MNYLKIYDDLVSKSSKAKRIKSKDEYFESHHIIPKSLGGSNDKSNLVLLTAREHYLAHKLLVKIYPDSYKMKFALFMMSHQNIVSAKGVSINSRMYENLRKDIIEVRKELASISNSFEFDNKISILPGVTNKLKHRWQWKARLRKAIAVVVSNGIHAYKENLLISYKRNKTVYSDKGGKVNSFYLTQSLDILSDLGYVENLKADADVPASKRKLSVYSLTKLGYDTFTTAGMRV